MVKKIIISWVLVLVIVFSIFYFSLTTHGYNLLILLLLPLIPLMIVFLSSKRSSNKKNYYIYGLALPVVLYYITYFVFVWVVINAVKNFTGLG